MPLRMNAVAAVLSAGLLALASVPGNAAPAKDWTPDPAPRAKLGPVTPVAGFQVRPPRGYAGRDVPSGGDALHTWAGPLRADGLRSIVMCERVLVPASSQDTLAGSFSKFMTGNSRHYRNWTRTPTQSGTLAGVAFVRTYWSGTDSLTGRKMRGFNYMGRRGSEFYLLGSQDSGPEARAALALAEASVRTFQPK